MTNVASAQKADARTAGAQIADAQITVAETMATTTTDVTRAQMIGAMIITMIVITLGAQTTEVTTVPMGMTDVKPMMTGTTCRLDPMIPGTTDVVITETEVPLHLGTETEVPLHLGIAPPLPPADDSTDKVAVVERVHRNRLESPSDKRARLILRMSCFRPGWP